MSLINATFKAITSIHHFLKLIVEQSHYVYSTQCIWISQIIESESEFKHFSVPRYPMYWSTELRCDAIPEAVTRNRFRKKPFLQYQYFSVVEKSFFNTCSSLSKIPVAARHCSWYENNDCATPAAPLVFLNGKQCVTSTAARRRC
ncbi:hypothetical protein Tsp_04621 [Trichinella spiralis]|uniref:hypothetical protein n=1 Tax=Trichinella spiralis TaxID=6334 RepID=UPI0001EFD58F|nr:hypothetical protein Tsp_04621 [Trichinella spiralis]